MFSRPKRKKQCRSVPAAAKGKFKPLPNIGSDKRPESSPISKPWKTTATPRSRTSRSCGGAAEHNSQATRPGKVNGLQRARDVVHYKSFGRSSDGTDEDATDRSMLPDPYAELETNLDSAMPLDPNAPWWLFLAEMRLQARRQAVRLEGKPDTKIDLRSDGKPDGKSDGSKSKSEKETKGQPDVCNSSLKSSSNMGSGEPGQSPTDPSAASDGDSKGKDDGAAEDDNNNDNEDEDDEEDDEAGLPPAVRAMQPKASTPSAREVMRERHKARMEEIARSVDKADLLSNLRTSGFFNYDYSWHARTTSNNHNLKNGKKKGTERLLTLLSYKSVKGASELYGL